MFCVVVDDFGVEYEGRDNAQHLIDGIASAYKMTTDWTGTAYCGLTLDWNYEHHTID
jgi:hypothetical protein